MAELGTGARVAGRVLVLLVAFGLGGLLLGPDADRPSDAETAHHAQVWTCSMHPQVRQPEPGTCPLCGMDLIPETPAEGASTEGVVLSPRAQALARVRTAAVAPDPEAVTRLRLLGEVEPAESTRREVTAWVGGRLDRLLLRETGARVRRGQVVARLYSPEVYTAHQDLLTARDQRVRAAEGPAARTAEATLAAARERLRLLGVPEDELAELEAAERPTRSVAIRSPFAGTVLERVATEGAYVNPGTPLYRLADLSRVWVQLDAYAEQLSALSVGQAVSLQSQALPGRVFEGRVAFVEPVLHPTRRTAKVRVEVDTADGALLPGMFARGEVVVGAAEGLVVPVTAPLFTGARSVVYVAGEGDAPAYAPREVVLGPRRGEVYPVLEGLEAGERVVVQGAFAVDAELQLRGGPSMMTRAGDRTRVPRLSVPARTALAPVLEAYLSVQEALADDALPGASEAATELAAAVPAVSLEGDPAARWEGLDAALLRSAEAVAQAEDLAEARAYFEHLTAAVKPVLTRLGNPLDRPLRLAFCPMAHDDQGAEWVQAAEDIDNAYFGAEMLACGAFLQTVAPGERLQADGRTP